MSVLMDQFLGIANKFGDRLVGTVVILFFSYIFITVISIFIGRLFDKAKIKSKTASLFIRKSIRWVLWILVLIMILGYYGVDVTALLAGLGVLGFIVGFALKDTLGNLASGVFIIINKPFDVGDYVEVNNIKGLVQSVGMAACELKTFDNQRITIPNSVIWGNSIINFTGQKKRRINIIVSVSYGSDLEKVEKVARNILKKDKRILKDPQPLVGPKDFKDSGIDFMIFPWVENDDYLGVKLDTIRAIKKEFKKAKIEIPFPQMDVKLKKR